ncbi:MAG: hypothetical protein ACFE0O_05530 [Opitutales bacterium]
MTASRDTPSPIICVQSLPAIGVAGLKAVLPVLGEHAIPVPSVILSGFGSHPRTRRFAAPLADNLEAVAARLADEGQSAVLHVGYLAGPDQIDEIRDLLDRHRSVFTWLSVDPVCGDGGRLYVDAAMPAAWLRLLRTADLAFPNPTEVQFLARTLGDGDPVGLSGEAAAQQRLAAWAPDCRWLFTSAPVGEGFGVRMRRGAAVRDYPHEERPVQVPGTGDFFAAQVLKTRFVRGAAWPAAVRAAIAATLKAIGPVGGVHPRQLRLSGEG